ncbi:glucosyltransferase domain-containing protein [Pseudomonas sp. NPDC087690]|jgi:hypothetical protein|uniref:glucosyltransferase domain-containing protein n=1 Tax=Pseudomonas sp. NPDC087690 TaxID=3364446 RepID=UPI0037F73A58
MQTGKGSSVKTIAKRAICGAFITLVMAWALLKSTALAPVITISTNHYPVMQSQLFFKHLDEYTERNSATNKLNAEDQTFRFTLPRYDDNLRWDPLEKSGTFYVRGLNVSILAYSRSLPLDNLTPLAQIEVTKRTSSYVLFTAPAGVTDPQVNIRIYSQALDRVRYLFALLFGLISATVILAYIKWHRQILNFMQSERTYISNFKSLFKRENFALSEFTKLLGIGIFLNIIPVVNFFLSVDDERGAFRTDPSIWIADGRWTAFLVEKFIFPQPVMPFVPNLFFYACLALAYMFMLRAHRLTFNWVTALAYCIFIAHPIWWFIGEFYSNVPSTGIGVLMLSIGVFAFSRIGMGKHNRAGTLKLALLSSFVLSLAIGAYQSLVMFYLVAGLGVILFEYRKENLTSVLSVQPTLKRIALLFVTLVGGVVLYGVFNKLAQQAYPTERNYIDNFLRINDLLADPILITKLVVVEMWKLYSGSIISYGVSFSSIAVVSGLAVLILMTQKTWKATLCMASVIAAILIAPFLLNFIAGGIYLPLRSMLAISFVAWVVTIVVLQTQGLLRMIGTVLAVFVLFQMVSVNGQYSASTIMATNHDRFTAEALYERISKANPAFDKNERVTVDVYGRLPFSSRYPAPESSTMSSSFFDWDQGNVYRMLDYMRLIGFTNVYPTSIIARIPLTPHFDKMPIWPAEGSVRYENGIYFIKLSETPDPTHAQYKRAASNEQ